VKETGRRDSNNEARTTDGARVCDNNVAYPPYELQPAGRQNFFHEPILSKVTQRWERNAHRLTRPGVTHGGEITNEIRDTQGPQLVDDRPRFQTIKNRPVFFPASPEWFHLGSYDAPLVGDLRRLAPLVEWSNSPLGGFGDGTGRQTSGESEHLRCETTDHGIPVEASVASRQQEGMYVEDTYEEIPYGPVPLWTNPPAVIQIQLQETVDGDQRPNLKPSQERLREH
jgi:hypothetical protein